MSVAAAGTVLHSSPLYRDPGGANRIYVGGSYAFLSFCTTLFRDRNATQLAALVFKLFVLFASSSDRKKFAIKIKFSLLYVTLFGPKKGLKRGNKLLKSRLSAGSH